MSKMEESREGIGLGLLACSDAAQRKRAWRGRQGKTPALVNVPGRRHFRRNYLLSGEPRRLMLPADNLSDQVHIHREIDAADETTSQRFEEAGSAIHSEARVVCRTEAR